MDEPSVAEIWVGCDGVERILTEAVCFYVMALVKRARVPLLRQRERRLDAKLQRNARRRIRQLRTYYQLCRNLINLPSLF
jgi:hypothetical protein